jgi:hypothetical protein
MKSNKQSISTNVVLLFQILVVILGGIAIYYFYAKNKLDIELFVNSNASNNNLVDTNKKLCDLNDEEKQSYCNPNDEEKQSYCKSYCNPENQKIQGYRSLESGATLKFEVIDKDSNEYYLHGPPYKVVSVETGNSLMLKAKSEVNISKQKFKRIEKNVDNTKCFVFTHGTNTPALALQYEHEHLSLRPLKADNSPFIGQCFVLYENATLEDIEANSLSLGIGVPRLGNEDLKGSGHDNLVLVSKDGEPSDRLDDAVESSDLLGDLTKKQYTDLLKLILKDVKIYDDNKPDDNNPFAIGENGLTLNVNLDGSKSGKEVSEDTFIDLKGDNSSTSVRQLLDTYTKSKKGSSFLEELNNDGNLNSVSQVLRNKFKGCPGYDRNKYYTERQIAQCTGCSPDNLLRGKL